MKTIIVLAIIALSCTGCSTTEKVLLPPFTNQEINEGYSLLIPLVKEFQKDSDESRFKEKLRQLGHKEEHLDVIYEMVRDCAAP